MNDSSPSTLVGQIAIAKQFMPGDPPARPVDNQAAVDIALDIVSRTKAPEPPKVHPVPLKPMIFAIQ